MDNLTQNTVVLSVYAMHNLFFNNAANLENEELIKIKDFAEEIVPRMNHDQFKSHFRLSVVSFEDLLKKSHDVYIKKVLSGNQGLCLDKQLMIFIWYMANIESFRLVADRFGVSVSTAWTSFCKICDIILEVNRCYHIISWRDNVALEQEFYRKTRFPGCVGAIDGSHIPIIAPMNSPNSYINRKGFHSMLLQAVCDSNYLFMDCYTGEAGSIHDNCLFRRSPLSRNLFDRVDNRYHLLGDSAYTLSNSMMVPYKDNGHLTNVQRNYNTVHSKTRVVIEQAYAFLKGRFRRLKLLETVRLDLMPAVIMAGCVLHNVCILNGDDINDINLEHELAEERLMNVEWMNENQLNVGQVKRDNIAARLQN